MNNANNREIKEYFENGNENTKKINDQLNWS